ncbi:hypothetical protein BJF83_10430 [Nocardiopsis sp. CNR-923]|uniref:hypothetical protein n=1 Tax=Nocardiopsis sp. CNR-923 TaxID=1904965 RepID=UPI00095DB48A|nr:hypothetical protein [Nocardiopsis sp. CNR-923]OLT29768.1 hypothetical protein BJF83_10430 [Nocardiopsis sp. CNR-923]
MPPSRRALPALTAVSGLVLACSAAAATAQDTDGSVSVSPSGVRVESGAASVGVGPGGVDVTAPDTRIQVRSGSYVLVCANGVRVTVRAGQAPPCQPASPEHPAPERPEHPERPERPGPSDPATPVDPGLPPVDDREPIGRRPPAEAGREGAAPDTSPETPAPAEIEEAMSSEPPLEASASPAAVPEAAEPVRERILADMAGPGGHGVAGAFTPTRTMVVVGVVAALAAAGSGRAAARRTG